MASSSKITTANYNINDLDIDLEKHLDHFTFETIMATISVDTKSLYRDVRSANFDPLKVKVKQDGVQRIRHFYLPKEKVTIKDEDTKGLTMDTEGKKYTDLASQITKHTIVENVYAPYARCADDVKHLTDVLINVARGNVKVYFPNAEYEEGIKMEELFLDLSESVTLFLPPEWEHAIRNHRKYLQVMDEKALSKAKGAKSGKPIALKRFRGDYTCHDDVSVTLFSDTTVSTNLSFQNKAYEFLNVQKALEYIDEIKSQRIQEDSRATEPNIVIGILDSGLMVNHLAFRRNNKVLARKNFVTPIGEDEPMDCGQDEFDLTADRHGHGTFCASIAAGERFEVRLPDHAPPVHQSVSRELMGVASFAKIVFGKVVDSGGEITSDRVVNGLRWILSLDGTDKQVDIISLSFGFEKFDAELRNVISEANMKGKIIVCAASNNGRKKEINIAFPARFGDVICVGSHDSNGQPSAFSPIGREIDFMAPGENVWGANSADEDAAFPMSGTSMATPFVAGIAAIVLKAAHHIGGDPLRQKVSNTTVMREVLRRMASKSGHHDEAMGYGNLDPYRLFSLGEDAFNKIVDNI